VASCAMEERKRRSSGDSSVPVIMGSMIRADLTYITVLFKILMQENRDNINAKMLRGSQ
jgi:hypothetical protein